MNGVGSRSVGDAFRSGQKRLDPVGDILRRFAELGDGPVGGIAFGDVVGAGMVDEALGEGGGQHQLAFGDGDEAVPQAVKPELGAAGLADAAVEMVDILHMAGGAGGRGKDPVANAGRVVVDCGQAAFENGRELPGDRKLQGHAGLGLLDPEGERRQTDPLPAECEHLLAAHAGVEPEPEGVPDRRVVHFRLDPGAPARQHLYRGRDLAPCLAVELAAAGEPQIDRIAQPVQVDAGPAVDRAQKRHRPVGRRPAVVGRDAVEAGLDILARGGVERAGEPVAQIPLRLVAVELVGALCAVGIGDRLPRGVLRALGGVRLYRGNGRGARPHRRRRGRVRKAMVCEARGETVRAIEYCERTIAWMDAHPENFDPESREPFYEDIQRLRASLRGAC